MTHDATTVTVDELMAMKVLLRDYMGDLAVHIHERPAPLRPRGEDQRITT